VSATPPVTAQPERRAPAARAAGVEGARAQLDEALLALREIQDPAVPVRRAEEQLAQALRACYLAVARRNDHLAYHAALDEAVAATRAVLGALQETPATDAATEKVLGFVAPALGALLSAGTLPVSLTADLPDGDPSPGTAFTPATVRVPAVIAPARSVLLPAVALPAASGAATAEDKEVEVPAPPAITDLAGVEALAKEAEAALAAFEDAGGDEDEDEDEDGGISEQEAVEEQIGGPAIAEAAIVFDRARNCLEEIAALGNMRRPLPGEPWAAPRTEERLLARLDAIAACGETVLPGLVKLLEDRPVPDPDLTWALLFLFGSLAGDDAADQVARLVLTTDLEAADMLLFVADALALAPSPALERPLRAWLDARRPAALRAAALAALGRRGQIASVEVAAAAGDTDARVALAAARALGRASGGVDPGLIERLLRHEDVAVVRAAMVSAIELRSSLGLEWARALTAERRGDRGDAALLLAVAGGADAWDAFARGGVAPAVLEGLGWFGDLRAMDVLIVTLRTGSPDQVGAAVAALYRLTGAALTDDDPDPTYEPGSGPFGRAFTEPQRPGMLTKRTRHWTAWWNRHRGEADLAVRYRFGHPWSPADDLWELEDAQSGSTERLLAYLELVARTGATVPLDLEDFVSRQHDRLAELRDHAERSGARAGEWPVRGG
jgi:hypothetical protein